MKNINKLFIAIAAVSCLFGANTMNVVATSVNAGATFWLEINIDNDDEFVGFQCDLDYPAGFTYLDAVLSAREDGHSLSKSDDAGIVTLIGFDLSNTPFEGNTGTVVSVQFTASSTPGNYTFSFAGDEDDVIISNSSSANICTGYSGATVTVNEVPLPIELSSFIADMTSKGVKLFWETATETENNCFHIYRDDVLIGEVEGAGTSSEPHSYEYIDKTVTTGTHIYVLADVNYAGIEDKHTQQAIEIEIGNDPNLPADFILHDVYPNPFNPSAMISYELPSAGLMDLSIFDLHGEKIYTLYSGFQYPGYYEILWHADHNPGGIYLLRLQIGQSLLTQKMLLIK